MKKIIILLGKQGIFTLFYTAILVTFLLILVTVHTQQKMTSAASWVAHTYQVLGETEKLLSYIKDTETGQRGFLLTGEESYLAPYQQGKLHLGQAFSTLQSLTRDNVQQQNRLISLEERIQEKLQELELTIQLRKSFGLDSALRIVTSGKGKIVMDKIRAELQDFEESEKKLLANRNQELASTTANMQIIQWLAGFFIITILLVTVSLLKKATKTQKTLFEQLEAQNKALVLNQGEECKLSAEGWERKEKEVVSQLVENLSNATEFIRQVGKGCYDVELKGITAKNMHLNLDNLSGSLLHMREQLKQANLVDQRRNWAAEGLANFSEILRGSYANLPELSYHIIAALVKYVKANQAGLFIVNQSNDQEIYLELMACYAYERKKYVTKKIAKGEGLVGQALLEKDTIYLTDVPKEYVQITSGLGGATPTSILIVPLLYNEQVFGVLELASFQAFAAHEIEFIEKLSESIASTLATVKINEQTKQLLEASQQQAEELRSQEEEMRQNMEELEATQEEAKRIYSEMDAQTNIINNIAIVSKTDLKGNITYVNEEFLKWSKYTREEVMGKNHRILKSGHQDDKIFEELWKTISSGKTFRGEIKNKAKDGTFYWVDAIIAPVLDEKGKPKEYIAQRFVIDEAKEKEAIVKAQNDIINSIAIVSKTDLKGNITYVNEEFLKWSKYTREEVIGKNHRILKSGDQDDKIFEELWKTISSGKIFRGEIKNKAKDGTFYWVDAIIAPVLDEKGKPKEYIAQRFVIDEAKEKEAQLAQAMRQAQALEKEIKEQLKLKEKTDKV